MNAAITVQQPSPGIESLQIYKRFRGEANSWIYPIKLNGTPINIRVNKNAMWVAKDLANAYTDEVWDFIGNFITNGVPL